MINGKDGVHRDNTTSSHMPVQIEILNNFNVKKVLELGVGFYSTKLYLDKCDQLISIESDSMEWFDKMKKHYGENTKWTHLFSNKRDEIRSILIDNIKFDLIFVDGSEFRSEETNMCFSFSDIIIVHDTQWGFRDLFEVPSDFQQIDFKKFPVSYGHGAGYDHRPWTTLFTNKTEIIEHFKNIQEEDLYNIHKFPYVYETTPNIIV